MVASTTRGARRVSPSVYKLLLTTHIIVSVGWLGITAAKLVLGLVAVTAKPELAEAPYSAMAAINIAFPPVAIATLVTGVVLSLGTKWGLLRHYWVATKLALTIAVVVSAVQLEERFVRQSVSTLSDPAREGAFLGAEPMLAALLLSLPVVHLAMLIVATVVSVYKPWGKTRRGRRSTSRAQTRLAASAAR
jgi:hypothetical protein